MGQGYGDGGADGGGGRTDGALAGRGRRADAAGLDRFGLIGHSLGGAVCATAAGAPERVTELVLVSAVGMPAGRSLLGYGLPLVAALRTTKPAFLRTLALDAVRWGPPRLLAGMLYATAADVREHARAIRAPALLLWGERNADPAHPAGDAEHTL